MISASKILCALAGAVALVSGGSSLGAQVLGRAATLVTNLQEHLIAQLASRTNNAGANIYGRFDSLNYVSGSLVLDTNFFLRSVTNIYAQSVGQLFPNPTNILSSANYATFISPRHCLAAAHTMSAGTPGAWNGRTNVWVLPDGTLYTNWVVAGACPGYDLGVLLMARTNPFYARVLPDPSTKLGAIRTGNPAYGVPVAVRFHTGTSSTNEWWTAFVSAAMSYGSFGGTYTGQFRFGDYQADYWISGDSGSAAYMVINNEAVLLCLATTGSGGTPPGGHLDLVNSAMASLSTNNAAPVYSLSVYDLSQFPNQ